MSDRVPIGTIPGRVTSQLDVDVMIAPASVAYVVTRVFLQRTDHTSSTITASVRNATAGGGEGIAVSITGTASEATNTGSVTVEATEPLYLRVTADDAASQNLRGWFEIDGSAAVTALLTTLARVKQFLGISGSADDDMLNNLIASVSDEVQKSLARRFITTTATSEKHSSQGRHSVMLNHYPVITVTTVTESDAALVEGTDFEATEEDLAIGQLVRISGTMPINWISGTRNIVSTYDHGYAAVPAGVVQAATELVSYDYRQAKGWFGLSATALDAGGESQYRSRDQVWRAQRNRFAGYTRVAL